MCKSFSTLLHITHKYLLGQTNVHGANWPFMYIFSYFYIPPPLVFWKLLPRATRHLSRCTPIGTRFSLLRPASGIPTHYTSFLPSRRTLPAETNTTAAPMTCPSTYNIPPRWWWTVLLHMPPRWRTVPGQKTRHYRRFDASTTSSKCLETTNTDESAPMTNYPPTCATTMNCAPTNDETVTTAVPPTTTSTTLLVENVGNFTCA